MSTSLLDGLVKEIVINSKIIQSLVIVFIYAACQNCDDCFRISSRNRPHHWAHCCASDWSAHACAYAMISCWRQQTYRQQPPRGQTIFHWQPAWDRTAPSGANQRGNAALASGQSLNLYVVKFTRNSQGSCHRRYCFGSYWCFSNLDLRYLHLCLL
jgi:hypothetical protein